MLIRMTKFIKAGIRLGKIHERNQKPHYTHLTPPQKRLVKAMEAVHSFEMSIAKEDMDPRNVGWRRTESGTQLVQDYLHATSKVARLREKLGVDIDAADALYASSKTARFSGGSF